MSKATSLGSDDWRLYRAPLRDEGAAGFPALDEAEAIGEVVVPGNLQLQLKFDDPWLDTPELTRLNHFEWLYALPALYLPRRRDVRPTAQVAPHPFTALGVDIVVDRELSAADLHELVEVGRATLDTDELVACRAAPRARPGPHPR